MKRNFRIADRLFFTALLLVTASVVFAQNYNRALSWAQTAKTISTADGKLHRLPSFSGAVHAEKYALLPVFSERLPAAAAAGNVKITLLQLVYQPVQILDKDALAAIGTEPKAEAVITASRGKYQVHVEVLPFRKNPSGGIERLQQFTMKVELTPSLQKRDATAYAANSVLASGSWYKLAVSANGMYKIDYNFLKNVVKADPASVPLNQLAVFGNGGGMVPEKNSEPRADDLLENPTAVVDNNGNNRMDADDYLLFYGQGPDAWRFNTANQTFTHEKNLYSDKNYYFLTTSEGTGKRVGSVNASGAVSKTITTFDDHVFHESEEQNMLKSGKVWLGDRMTALSNIKSFSFSFPSLIQSEPVKLVSVVGAKTSYGSNTQVRVNGQLLITHSDPGINPNNAYPEGAKGSSVATTFAANSDNLNVQYTFNVTNDPTGTAAVFIDWFELHLKRNLSMSGDVMPFRSIESAAPGSVSEFRLGNSGNNIAVWDVTNAGNIFAPAATVSGNQLIFSANTDELREYVAFNTAASFGAPEFSGQVENQNLHGIGEPDMIIVTPDAFASASEELARFHRESQGITANVVRINHIYNEFGSGKKDISAIRDFMRMLYDRASGDTALMPRYLLLMGDGSFDPKDRVSGNKEFIPTYQSLESFNQLSTFTSDDFYGLLDPTEGGNIASVQDIDVAIGRLPVETEQEAWDVVNKIKNYKTPQTAASCVQITTNNSWRNTVTFIADDEDGNTHQDASDFLAESSRAVHPEYNYEKIYLDAYKQVPTPAGDRYPDVNTAILNRLNSGSLIFNWIGHGGETNWAHERIFNMSDIVNLNNKEKLPLFITATCEFSRFDLPDRTAGEWLIVNGKGGAIGSLTTVRLVFSSANEALNTKAFDYLFQPFHDREPTLGELTMLTKNNVVTDINNTRKFTLLGDPALVLNYPKYDVVTTAVNGTPLTQPVDTFKALSKVTVTGEVRDEQGQKMTGFTGVVYPVVYDKISNLQTLSNDAGSPQRTFKLFRNLLFKGKASVTNGEFSFTFIVPKDIDYQFGNGRISYYAENLQGADAHGYTSTVVIGGAADSFATDGNGPELSLFMNDRNFAFGGMTDANPILLAVLEDESGINTTGNGIGHDMTAVLDDNTQNRIVLNDYYESVLDTFNRGEVRYPFSKLADGKHTLKVKAWDIHNNSGEAYTEFVVASSAKIALRHVYNYPNPFTTRTRFMFEHNRPCDNLKVSVQIYSVAGRLVKSLQAETFCEGYRVDDLEWDGTDDYGDPIGKGVYVYKLLVRDSQGNSAHQFEKLVVLR